MSDGPRFPPPRGEEAIGYRDAGAPISDEKPEPPVPDGPLVPRGKRVVASRPDDPDVALAKAFTPPRPRPNVSRASGALIALLVAVYVLWQVALQLRHC